MVDILTAAMGAKMASAQVQSQIDTALSSVYKYKGQCTNAELANKTKTAGDVWEITDTGTYAAGTDVVCDGTSWAAMTGHLHVNVIDSLDSTSATDALSANMGKALADGKQDKLTAGTGISISEQNVISASGGGGGDWTLRTANNDWSDLFEVDGNYVVAKKDIIFVLFNYLKCFVSKGTSGYSGIFLHFAGDSFGGSNKIIYKRAYGVSLSNIGSNYTDISKTESIFTFTTDGTDITITDSNTTGTQGKSGFTIYTKE